MLLSSGQVVRFEWQSAQALVNRSCVCWESNFIAFVTGGFVWLCP